MNSYCDIAASDGSGSMKAYLAMPARKPKAGIVVIQEILGVNKDIRVMTDAWAANGYAAIAPDLFWRLKPGVELDADIPDEFQEGLDLLQKFNAYKSVEDLSSQHRRPAVAWLRQGRRGRLLPGWAARLSLRHPHRQRCHGQLLRRRSRQSAGRTTEHQQA